MTQEEKQLLIKDLCCRIPYNCIVSIAEGGINGIVWADVTLTSYWFHQIMEEDAWEYVKPYLRPISSMSEEEYQEFNNIRIEHTLKCLELDSEESFKLGLYFQQEEISNYLYQRHFDICDLISKGLALNAQEGMYNN
jgi:hypothetical protein